MHASARNVTSRSIPRRHRPISMHLEAYLDSHSRGTTARTPMHWPTGSTSFGITPMFRRRTERQPIAMNDCDAYAVNGRLLDAWLQDNKGANRHISIASPPDPARRRSVTTSKSPHYRLTTAARELAGAGGCS